MSHLLHSLYNIILIQDNIILIQDNIIQRVHKGDVVLPV